MAETIAFSKSLYALEAVQAAAAAYADLARVEVAQQNDDIVVTLSDPDPSVADEIAAAFSNHALNETILLRHRKAGQTGP